MPEATGTTTNRMPEKAFEKTTEKTIDKTADRLRVLLDSSTPIVVMETVEESRAVRLVRLACQSLNLSSFEWTIASGLVRSGMAGAAVAGSGLVSALHTSEYGIEHGLP